MNFAKFFIVVALALCIVNASQLYPREHRCAAECVSQKNGYNCGRLTQSCCKSEALCVSEWGMKKCKERTDFECKII